MSYLVMARKWRPKNFDEMVGQEHIAQTLRNAIATGRVSHAFLFTGTRGVGKTTAARILAKALNCQKGPTANPCEECDNCLAVNRGASMDVLEIDGASNNSVDDVRELREQVSYAPMQGEYKIYIIDEVHMLSKSAFNALLKTLEEPPPHVVFIFATTESNKVPHTILSRVQRFDFKRISEAQIRERLEFICSKEGITPERAALEALARKADGSMRDALSLFDRVYAFAGENLTLEAARKALGIPAESMYDDLLRAVAGHDTAACLAVLNGVYEEGLEVSEFLAGFGESLRDILFARQPGITPALLGLDAARFAALRELAGDLRDGDILRYAKVVSDLLGGLRTAPHPRLWVELGLARMAALDRVVTLTQLLGQEPAPVPSAPAAEEKKKSPELTVASRKNGNAPSSAAPLAAEPPPPQEPTPVDTAPPIPEPAPSPEPAPEPADETPEDEFSAGPDTLDAGEESLWSAQGTADSAAPPPGLTEGAPPTLLDSLDAVAARWADLVEDFALDRPFTSSPLRHSRVEARHEDGDAALTVVFANPHQHDLFLADGDNRKALRAFLASRLAPETSFALLFSAPDGDGTGETVRAILPPESPEAILAGEPVLRKLMEAFEGRLLR